MSIKKKIPTKFKLFATTINVEFNNRRMNDKQQYGECSYSKSLITLSTTAGTENLSEDRIIDCFYHEKVHAILDAMREDQLSGNEKFVDTFAKLLRQADETVIFTK